MSYRNDLNRKARIAIERPARPTVMRMDRLLRALAKAGRSGVKAGPPSIVTHVMLPDPRRTPLGTRRVAYVRVPRDAAHVSAFREYVRGDAR